MNFNPKEFKDNVTSYDRLMEEKMVEEYLLNEQRRKIQNIIGLPWDNFQLDVDFYISFPKKVKLTRKELNEMLDKNPNLFKDAFKGAINKSLGSKGAASISEENINKLSDYWMDKIKTDKNFNKSIRYSLFTMTDEDKGVIKIEIEPLKPNKGVTVTVKGEDTEIPEIPLRDESKKKVVKSSTKITDISKFVNDLNFNNIGGSQYKVGKQSGSGYKNYEYLYLKPVKDQLVIVSTPVESKGDKGDIKKGPPEYIEEPLDINFAEVFPVGEDQGDQSAVIKYIMSKVNEKLKELNEKSKSKEGSKVEFVGIKAANIIGSATNAWRGGDLWLPPTHKIGDPFGAAASSGPSSTDNGPFAEWAQNVDFKSQPNGITGDNQREQTKNAMLAWNRIQLVNNSVNSINSNKNYKESNINSEWRVTDTGGQLGHDGQFVKAKMLVVFSYETPGPVNVTPGQNTGTILSYSYKILPARSKSGWNFDFGSLFVSGERVGRGGKFMSQKKAERRFKRGKRGGSSF
jgi:hypothetical protein